MSEITAYQRGWNESQDWQHPHTNPYPFKSLEWFAWSQGYEEGALSALAAARRVLQIRQELPQ